VLHLSVRYHGTDGPKDLAGVIVGETRSGCPPFPSPILPLPEVPMIRLAMLSLVLVLGACKKNAPIDAAGSDGPLVTRDTPTSVPVQPDLSAQMPEDVKEMMRNFERVYFGLDSAKLSGDALEALQQNAAIMQRSPGIKVEIQGHADERGTTDYNLSLGQRRASSVSGYLTRMGVGEARLDTVSFGEERPLVNGSTEGAWSKNRRAEFRITWGSGHGTVQ
jgi:peptidoglycan-associated lipoprotein